MLPLEPTMPKLIISKRANTFNYTYVLRMYVKFYVYAHAQEIILLVACMVAF